MQYNKEKQECKTPVRKGNNMLKLEIKCMNYFEVTSIGVNHGMMDLFVEDFEEPEGL